MKVKKGRKVPKNAKFVTICCKIGKNNGNESLQNISALSTHLCPIDLSKLVISIIFIDIKVLK